MDDEEIAQFVTEFTEDPAAGDTIREIAADPERFLNRLHVPDDAGEYTEALTTMLNRIPDGWGRWIRCSKGWYPIITELDAALAAIDPKYKIHQVKEKFGTLRYYCSIDGREESRPLIRAAEEKSAVTCETCGALGTLVQSSSGWYHTACQEHANA